MEWSRVILHIDCDSFFVQVHEQRGCREDKTGGEELIGRPVAVWQYRDVFCVNHLARRLGIEKHSDPRKVESSLVDAGGFLIHAFYRTFPGPRVWYGPYHRASRDVFHLIRSILNPRDILEKVSIDEAYVDLTLSTNGSISKALDVAERIRRECRSKIHYVVSIGIAENRLLAKLGSVEAKPDGIYVVSDVDKLLHTSKPTKLPGLGVKMQRFQHWKTIAELQVFGVRDLMVNLEISEEAATRVFNACRGVDLKPVTASTAPKSIVLTSWVVVGTLQDLFSRVHLGRGVFPGVVVGSGYVFEPHQTANLDELHTSSGPSRIRWVLLALAMDLDERILVADEDHGIRPGKIGFQFEVPGAKGKIGSGVKVGGATSRSRAFPEAFWRFAPTDPSSPFSRPADSVEAFEDQRYAARIGTLIDVVADIVHEMCTRDKRGSDSVAQVGLSVSGFRSLGGKKYQCETESSTRPSKLRKRTITDHFSPLSKAP